MRARQTELQSLRRIQPRKARGSKTLDLEVVKPLARNRWPQILAGVGIRLSEKSLHKRHDACPGCGGKDRFRFTDAGGDGFFFCTQGGNGNVSGDGFQLIRHVFGCPLNDAINRVAQQLGLNSSTPTEMTATSAPSAIVPVGLKYNARNAAALRQLRSCLSLYEGDVRGVDGTADGDIVAEI